MAFGKERAVGLFIDGPNLFATAEAVELNIDYEALLKYYKKRGLLRAYHYTALPPREETSPLRPLIDWLDFHGYTVISKPTKSFRDPSGDRKLKGNMDAELILDVVDLSPHLTDVVIFSGDGDFAPLLRWVQKRGIRTTVVSTTMSRPSPMVADELRRCADTFIDLGDNPDYPSDLRKAITRVDTRTIPIRRG